MLDKGNFRLQKFSHFALIEKVKSLLHVSLYFFGTMLPPLKLALMLSCDRFIESALFVQVLNGLLSFTLLNSLTPMHLVSATVSITIFPDGLMTFTEIWRCCCVCNKRQSSAQHMVRLTAIICQKLFMLSTLLKTKKSKTFGIN